LVSSAMLPTLDDAAVDGNYARPPQKPRGPY
jgi:hypothetical protein